MILLLLLVLDLEQLQVVCADLDSMIDFLILLLHLQDLLLFLVPEFAEGLIILFLEPLLFILDGLLLVVDLLLRFVLLFLLALLERRLEAFPCLLLVHIDVLFGVLLAHKLVDVSSQALLSNAFRRKAIKIITFLTGGHQFLNDHLLLELLKRIAEEEK